MKKHRSIHFTVSLLIITTLTISSIAGPPLICHPFEIGEAKSIAWNGRQWRDVKKDYDINQLVPDVMAILETDAPILVRMETMRRAAVYAVWSLRDAKVGFDPKGDRAAIALLDKILAHKNAAEVRGFKTKADKLALFDAGYLLETYKYIGFEETSKKTVLSAESLAWVEKANNALDCPGEIELALAIILQNHPGTSAAQDKHLETAVGKAAEGSLLAKNIISHFPDKGASLTALKASLK